MALKMQITARPTVLPYLSISVLLSIIAGIQFNITSPLLQMFFHSMPQAAYYLEVMVIFLLCAIPMILWRFTFFVLDAESLQLCSFTLPFMKKRVNLNTIHHIRVERSGPLSGITGSRRVEFIDGRGKTVFEWNSVRMNDELLKRLRRTSLLLLSEHRVNSSIETKRPTEEF